MNSNVKPQVDMQGIIKSLIQPEVIYKSISQQIGQDLAANSRLQNGIEENHVYINSCSVNDKEFEDRQAAFLNPDQVHTVKISHILN